MLVLAHERRVSWRIWGYVTVCAPMCHFVERDRWPISDLFEVRCPVGGNSLQPRVDRGRVGVSSACLNAVGDVGLQHIVSRIGQ